MDVKKVVGVVGRGIGVGAAAVGFYKAEVAVGFWVFFSAYEEHVFQKMRKTWALFGVMKAAPEDRERCCRFIGGGV